jgi:RHS repeat-associated protein
MKNEEIYGLTPFSFPGRGDVYKYDASDKLTNVVYDATNPDTTPSGGTNLVTYYFDAAANRTSVVQVIPNTSTNTTTYLVNKLNQYTNVSNQTYTYDAKGNLTNDGSQTYTYDYESRLIEAYAYPYTYTYSYDVFGRLVGRKRGTVWNRYYYAGWQLIEERAHAGGLLGKYVYGPGLDEPIRMYRSSTNYYYHTDGLGNVTEITDGSGNLVEQYCYDVYGKLTIRDGSTNVLSASAIGNRLMFNARDRDPDTLLYNYRYRYYSPGLGRFVQPDPVIWLNRDPSGLPGFELQVGRNPNVLGHGPNLYAFVHNNAVNAHDPTGLYSIEEIKMWLNALDEGMKQMPMGSPEWYEAQATKNRLYGLLRSELNKQAACRAAGRAGAVPAAAGVGAFTGYYIRNNVNYGFQTFGAWFWDWLYGNPFGTSVPSGPEPY